MAKRSGNSTGSSGDRDLCGPELDAAVSALQQMQLASETPVEQRNAGIRRVLRRLLLLPNIVELTERGHRPEWDNYRHNPTTQEKRALRIQRVVSAHDPFLGMAESPEDVEGIIAELQALQWGALNAEAETDDAWYARHRHEYDHSGTADSA